jgi:hypothetical protein
MTIGHFAEIPAALFLNWDVICGDVIGVKIRSSTERRSASLWYSNLGDGRYRWYEVGYYDARRANDPNYPNFVANIYSMGPDTGAIEAAAALDPHAPYPDPPNQLAHKPRPIDDDQINKFCERWIEFFAAASTGTLIRPSKLPER